MRDQSRVVFRAIVACAVVLSVAAYVVDRDRTRALECTAAYETLLKDIEEQVQNGTNPSPTQFAARREWIERCARWGGPEGAK